MEDEVSATSGSRGDDGVDFERLIEQISQWRL
jgi:hypothetical protein